MRPILRQAMRVAPPQLCCTCFASRLFTLHEHQYLDGYPPPVPVCSEHKPWPPQCSRVDEVESFCKTLDLSPEPSLLAASQKDLSFESKANVLHMLEEAAAALNGSAGEDLGDAFKRYRQAVFKLNYKINKFNTGKKGAKVGVHQRDMLLALSPIQTLT